MHKLSRLKEKKNSSLFVFFVKKNLETKEKKVRV